MCKKVIEYVHMPESLDKPKEISSLRKIGNLAIAGVAGIATLEAANLITEHTILPIFLGVIVAATVFTLLRRSS